MLAPVPQDLCRQVVDGQSPFQVRHGYEGQAGNDRTDDTFQQELSMSEAGDLASFYSLYPLTALVSSLHAPLSASQAHGCNQTRHLLSD